jgi:hypothetical protein
MNHLKIFLDLRGSLLKLAISLKNYKIENSYLLSIIKHSIGGIPASINIILNKF